MDELLTLEEKIAHIIKAIESSGEMVEEAEEVDDFLDTNKVKMLYNISTQTENLKVDASFNTTHKFYSSDETQTLIADMSRSFKL